MIPVELALDTDGLAELDDPVLLIALAGLFDVAGVASAALDHIVEPGGIDGGRAVIVGEIDPDPFYDFTVERPMVEIVFGPDGEGEQTISWPGNVIRAVRTGATRDLVALSGVEPHLRWTTYIRCVLAIVERLNVSQVVTLGSTADVTPHTRMPVVVGSTADRALAREFALAAPRYQGVTGLVGVLHSELERIGVPSVSLRVGVPHYLASGEHPRAVLSLIRHAAHVVGVPFAVELGESVARWDEAHNAAIADDDKLRRYVEILEAEYDRRAEDAVTPADDLAASFEAYLRDDAADRDQDDKRGTAGDGTAGDDVTGHTDPEHDDD